VERKRGRIRDWSRPRRVPSVGEPSPIRRHRPILATLGGRVTEVIAIFPAAWG
jgi:hypothetical protein